MEYCTSSFSFLTPRIFPSFVPASSQCFCCPFCLSFCSRWTRTTWQPFLEIIAMSDVESCGNIDQLLLLLLLLSQEFIQEMQLILERVMCLRFNTFSFLSLAQSRLLYLILTQYVRLHYSRVSSPWPACSLFCTTVWCDVKNQSHQSTCQYFIG